MRKITRGTSRWLVAILLLLSNDASGSSNLLDTSGEDLHDDSSAKPEQQHGSASAASDGDESYSPVGCSESEDRNSLRSKCRKGASGMLPSFGEQSTATDVVDAHNSSSESAIHDLGFGVADDIANHLATASIDGSSTLPPPPLPPTTSVQRAHSRISAVLVLNLKDAPLAKLLMTTLRACGGMDIFRELFVVVPGGELSQIESILHNNKIVDDNNKDASVDANAPNRTPIVMVDERELLRTAGVDKVESSWFPYSLQMILKLLVSSLMRTPFYLTLDADVLCTKDGLSEEDLLPQGKGNYVPEGRHVHSTWWSDAAQALGVEEEPLGGGFGVTPAVLSTEGAMLVFERLRTVHGSASFLRRILDISLSDSGGRWTEYTMYRTGLDYFGVFDSLHAVGPTKLLGGHSVWYPDQFESWNVTAAFDEDPAAFVVVQSTAQAGVSAIVRKIGHGLEAEDWGEKNPRAGPKPALRGRIVRQVWPQ